MANKNYHIGSYVEEGLHGGRNGWIVGSFMDELPHKTDDVEIKYWEFTKGQDTQHPMKVSEIMECTFLLKGSIRGVIDEEKVTVKAGEYFLISPGVPNNVFEDILEDAAGITIKAPSDPDAKQVIG